MLAEFLGKLLGVQGLSVRTRWLGTRSDVLRSDQPSTEEFFFQIEKTGRGEVIFFPERSVTDPRSLEEERRLAYVGITRAQRRLYMTYAASRGQWGETWYNRRSRFVDEIPGSLAAEV